MAISRDTRPGPWTLAGLCAAAARQSRLAAVCFMALATGIVIAVVTATPTYEGRMKLLVKQDRTDSVVSGAPGAERGRAELTEADLLSQAELIRAADLLENVAKDTGLAERIAAREDEDYPVALARAIRQLREDLSVTPLKRTWLIDVGYRADDPALTRLVLDTLAQRYLEKHLALQRPSGTFHFFAEQAARARQELADAQAHLEDFSRTHNVVSAAREKESVLQQLAQFDALRNEARATLAATTQQLSTIATELKHVPAQHTAQIRTIEGTAAVQDIQSRVVGLELTRAELLQRFTPTYRGVQEIEEQIRQARAALQAARNAPVREETIADNPTRQWLDTERARVRAENAATEARLRALSGTVGNYRVRAQELNTQDARQRDLERQVKEAEEKYLLYARKQEEARISDELDKTRIANVVVAQAPAVSLEAERTPSLASVPLLLGAALLLSLALAIACDALVRGLVTREDVAATIWVDSALSPDDKRRAVLALYDQPRPTT